MIENGNDPRFRDDCASTARQGQDAVTDRQLLVASDIGGTFTDTVTIDSAGHVGRYKSPTVPGDPALGVLATMQLAADERGIELEQFVGGISHFAHGTTAATNAMIEDKRAPVGLIQTRGFGDTLPIMRGFKGLGLEEDELKSFRTLVKQPLVVPRRLIGEVTERVDYQGRVVIALDEEDARRSIIRLLGDGAETFAVSLLWSFKNPSHEQRLAELISELAPDAPITISSDLLPRLGEYRRSATTAINASLRPTIRRAVSTLEQRLRATGLSCEPFLMKSNGGLAPVGEIDREAAATLMSGPVGGIIACDFLGELEGRRNIVTADMGGTSFDVGLILDGSPLVANSTWIGRHEIALPSVAVRTIGAGSGSIARAINGMLAVGPESAGADPGPACYGRGGELPTVADADLVLGYVNPDNFLAGRLQLDVGKSRAALGTHVAEPLGMSIEDAAEGIKTIVDARMSDLIRQMTIEQGYDPADFTIFAFGGAGPTHASGFGSDLGIAEIVVPLTASVHSAFGIGASDIVTTEELSDPMQSAPGELDYGRAFPARELNARFAALTEKALNRLARAGVQPETVRIARSVEMRFRAQIHVLSVPVLEEGPMDDVTVDALVRRFLQAYEARFGEGSAYEGAGVQLTTFRVTARSPVRRPRLRRSDASASTVKATGQREIYRGGEWKPVPVYLGDSLAAGAVMPGPAVIEMPDTTIVVAEHQTARADDHGSIVITN